MNDVAVKDEQELLMLTYLMINVISYSFISSLIQTSGGPTAAGCASANFSTCGVRYSQVCDRLSGNFCCLWSIIMLKIK